MKKLCLTILLVVMALLLLSSCSKNNGPFSEVSVSYDGQQRVIQKVMYNENNGCTWVYDYSYTTYNNGEVLCTNTTITIYDANNRVVDQTTNVTYDNQPSLPVGSTNNNNNTNTETETKPTDTQQNNTQTKPSTNQSEKVLMNESGIKVTLISATRDEFWDKTDYKIMIENSNKFEVCVHSNNEYLNDVSCENVLGCSFYSNIAAGKKSYETINIYDSDLEELDITTPEKFEFTIHATKADDLFTYIAEEDVVLNLK